MRVLLLALVLMGLLFSSAQCEGGCATYITLDVHSRISEDHVYYDINGSAYLILPDGTITPYREAEVRLKVGSSEVSLQTDKDGHFTHSVDLTSHHSSNPGDFKIGDFDTFCTTVVAEIDERGDILGATSSEQTVCLPATPLFSLQQVMDRLDEKDKNTCMMFFIVLGILIAGLYVSGKNPFAFIDITTPRLPKAKKKLEIAVQTRRDAIKVLMKYSNKLRKEGLRLIGSSVDELARTEKRYGLNSIKAKVLRERVDRILRDAEEKVRKKKKSKVKVKEFLDYERDVYIEAFNQISRLIHEAAERGMKEAKATNAPSRIIESLRSMSEHWNPEIGEENVPKGDFAQALHTAQLMVHHSRLTRLVSLGPLAPAMKTGLAHETATFVTTKVPVVGTVAQVGMVTAGLTRPILKYFKHRKASREPYEEKELLSDVAEVYKGTPILRHVSSEDVLTRRMVRDHLISVLKDALDRYGGPGVKIEGDDINAYRDALIKVYRETSDQSIRDDIDDTISYVDQVMTEIERERGSPVSGAVMIDRLRNERLILDVIRWLRTQGYLSRRVSFETVRKLATLDPSSRRFRDEVAAALSVSRAQVDQAINVVERAPPVSANVQQVFENLMLAEVNNLLRPYNLQARDLDEARRFLKKIKDRDVKSTVNTLLRLHPDLNSRDEILYSIYFLAASRLHDRVPPGKLKTFVNTFAKKMKGGYDVSEALQDAFKEVGVSVDRKDLTLYTQQINTFLRHQPLLKTLYERADALLSDEYQSFKRTLEDLRTELNRVANQAQTPAMVRTLLSGILYEGVDEIKSSKMWERISAEIDSRPMDEAARKKAKEKIKTELDKLVHRLNGIAATMAVCTDDVEIDRRIRKLEKTINSMPTVLRDIGPLTSHLNDILERLRFVRTGGIYHVESSKAVDLALREGVAYLLRRAGYRDTANILERGLPKGKGLLDFLLERGVPRDLATRLTNLYTRGEDPLLRLSRMMEVVIFLEGAQVNPTTLREALSFADARLRGKNPSRASRGRLTLAEYERRANLVDRNLGLISFFEHYYSLRETAVSKKLAKVSTTVEPDVVDDGVQRRVYYEALRNEMYSLIYQSIYSKIPEADRLAFLRATMGKGPKDSYQFNDLRERAKAAIDYAKSRGLQVFDEEADFVFVSSPTLTDQDLLVHSEDFLKRYDSLALVGDVKDAVRRYLLTTTPERVDRKYLQMIVDEGLDHAVEKFIEDNSASPEYIYNTHLGVRRDERTSARRDEVIKNMGGFFMYREAFLNSLKVLKGTRVDNEVKRARVFAMRLLQGYRVDQALYDALPSLSAQERNTLAVMINQYVESDVFIRDYNSRKEFYHSKFFKEWAEVSALREGHFAENLGHVFEDMAMLRRRALYEESSHNLFIEFAREYNRDKRAVIEEINAVLGVVDPSKAKDMEAEDLLLRLDEHVSKTLHAAFQEFVEVENFPGMEVYTRAYPYVESMRRFHRLFSKSPVIRDRFTEFLKKKGFSAKEAEYLTGFYGKLAGANILHFGVDFPQAALLKGKPWIQDVRGYFKLVDMDFDEWLSMGPADRVVGFVVEKDTNTGRPRVKGVTEISKLHEVVDKITNIHNEVFGDYIGLMAEISAEHVVLTRYQRHIKSMFKYFARPPFLPVNEKVNATVQKAFTRLNVILGSMKTLERRRDQVSTAYGVMEAKFDREVRSAVSDARSPVEEYAHRMISNVSEIQRFYNEVLNYISSVNWTSSRINLSDVERRMDDIQMNLRDLNNKIGLSSYHRLNQLISDVRTAAVRGQPAKVRKAVTDLKDEIVTSVSRDTTFLTNLRNALNDVIKKARSVESVYLADDYDRQRVVDALDDYKDAVNRLKAVATTMSCSVSVTSPANRPTFSADNLVEDIDKNLADMYLAKNLLRLYTLDTQSLSSSAVAQRMERMGAKDLKDAYLMLKGPKLRAIVKKTFASWDIYEDVSVAAGLMDELLAIRSAVLNSDSEGIQNRYQALSSVDLFTSEGLSEFMAIMEDSGAVFYHDIQEALTEQIVKREAYIWSYNEKVAAIDKRLKELGSLWKKLMSRIEKEGRRHNLSSSVLRDITSLKLEDVSDFDDLRARAKDRTLRAILATVRDEIEDILEERTKRERERLTLVNNRVVMANMRASITKMGHMLNRLFWLITGSVKSIFRPLSFKPGASLSRRLAYYTLKAQENWLSLSRYQKLINLRLRNMAFYAERIFSVSGSVFASKSVGAHTRLSMFGLDTGAYEGFQFAGPISSPLIQEMGVIGRGVFGLPTLLLAGYMSVGVRKGVALYDRYYPIIRAMGNIPEAYQPVTAPRSFLRAMYYTFIANRTFTTGLFLRTIPEKAAGTGLYHYLLTSNSYGILRLDEIMSGLSSGLSTPKGFVDVLNYYLMRPNDMDIDFKDPLFGLKDGRSMPKTPQHLNDMGMLGIGANTKFLAGREIYMMPTGYGTANRLYPNRAANTIIFNPQLTNAALYEVAYGDMYIRTARPSNVAIEMSALKQAQERWFKESLVAAGMPLATLATALGSRWWLAGASKIAYVANALFLRAGAEVHRQAHNYASRTWNHMMTANTRYFLDRISRRYERGMYDPHNL